MVLIVITGKEAGRGHIYEERKMQGRRKLVPTYAAFALCQRTGRRLDFAVTRDTSPCVFGGLPGHFGEGGECPPNVPGQPYCGRVRTDAAVGWCVQLFEEWCPNKESLRGIGAVARRHILLHFGARRSEGCLMVSGGRHGWSSFKRFLSDLTEPDDIGTIEVVIQERRLTISRGP